MTQSKYGNQKVEYNGLRFDSKGERDRWIDLTLLEKAGKVRDLTRQSRYKIEVDGMHICNYVADFVYWDVAKDRWVVEDFKGHRTREYLLKRKLMKAVYDVDILETTRRRR